MENHRALLELARAETGLEDFGDDAFTEGLEILVGSLRDEAGLNAEGDRVMRGRIIAHLSQRLQVEDWYRRHPEIKDESITAPLFGISLPRTGSTALSFLLTCDPGVRYLRVWEGARPCPPPSTVHGPDPRRAEMARIYGAFIEKAHAPSGIDGATECLDVMALDFRSHTFGAYAKIPRYSYWLQNTDLASTYEYERRVLKLLQWGEPTRPWRLKSPMHLIYLDDLDKVFPDARFVMTHRDPTEVIVSVANVYTDLAGRFSDHVDHAYFGELNVHIWTEGMRRAMAFRERGNAHRFYDIDFRAMQDAPVDAVRQLYTWLGEPVNADFASNMAEWWQGNEERGRSAKLDPKVFGIDLDLVRARFADYLDSSARWTSSSTMQAHLS